MKRMSDSWKKSQNKGRLVALTSHWSSYLPAQDRPTEGFTNGGNSKPRLESRPDTLEIHASPVAVSNYGP